jgi:hypothetical protein
MLNEVKHLRDSSLKLRLTQTVEPLRTSLIELPVYTPFPMQTRTMHRRFGTILAPLWGEKKPVKGRFRTMQGFRTLFVATIALVLATSAHALTFVNSRPALGGNDYVDWGVLGPSFTVVNNPFTVTSNGGLSMSVSKPGGPFERRDQGNGWSGNFAPGDHLIWTRDEIGAMTIEFAVPVLGAGAQIQRDAFGLFTGTIQAYDSLNNLLGSFNLTGNSAFSTIFLGVLDNSPSIKKIVFMTDGGSEDFAINRLDLVTQGGPVIPEPGTMLLMGIGGLAIGLGRRFGRK